MLPLDLGPRRRARTAEAHRRRLQGERMVTTVAPGAAFVRFMHQQPNAQGRPLSELGTRPTDLDVDRVLEVVERLAPLFGGERAWFPLDARGFDTLPATPCLIVSNHSGGTSIPDAWGLAVSWYRQFGRTRPLHALAHDMVFALRATAEPFSRLGILRAGRDVALRTLRDHGRDLAVMPGGDLDTWRPHRDRYKVRFSGRRGYARLAIAAQAPIVPIAHAGAHDTLFVLTDGQRLARWLHLHELFRAEVFPVHLSAPFGLAIGPLPHLPPPVTLRYRVADAVVPPVLEPGAPIPDAWVGDVDAEVRRRLQVELDGLRDDMPAFGPRLRRRIGRIRRALRA